MTPKCPSPIHPSLDPSGSTLSLDRYPRNIDTTLELRGLGEREKERRPEARELGAGVRNTHCFFPRRPSWRPQERSRFPLFSFIFPLSFPLFFPLLFLWCASTFLGQASRRRGKGEFATRRLRADRRWESTSP